MDKIKGKRLKIKVKAFQNAECRMQKAVTIIYHVKRVEEVRLYAYTLNS